MRLSVKQYLLLTAQGFFIIRNIGPTLNSSPKNRGGEFYRKKGASRRFAPLAPFLRILDPLPRLGKGVRGMG
jgi:hypothetical protein